MKLISMTDYLMELTKNNFIGSGGVSNEILLKAKNYANFLKQPLKLEMFIPCIDGKPFTDFQLEILNSDDGVPELRKAYQQAEEKVLFLRFDGSDFDYSLAKVYLENYFNIEQLSNEVKEQILTKNAIKQLGL